VTLAVWLFVDKFTPNANAEPFRFDVAVRLSFVLVSGYFCEDL